jgi:hypothetical protein
MDALVAYVRKVNAKGGRVIINHMHLVPRTLAQENAFYCAETNDGDHRCASLHLAPTVIGLANPDRMENPLDIYHDIRAKLSWGALFAYYYWSCRFTHPMITTAMYPITVQEIRPGLIRGRERIITLHSGVYGWPGDRDLHCAVLADAKGRLVPSHFLTTVDRSGVRTEIVLREDETAVLKKIPVTLEPSEGTPDSPVNLVAVQYDAEAIELSLNGQGQFELRVRDGDFRIGPGVACVVKGDPEQRVRADPRGTLLVVVELDGELRLRIELEGGRP